MWDIEREFIDNNQSEKTEGLEEFLKGTPVLDEIGKNLNNLMLEIDDSQTEDTHEEMSMIDAFKENLTKKVKTTIDHK